PPLDVAQRSAGVPMWARRAGWLAVIAGVVGGPIVHRARNAASDATAFQQALARDDAESWRAYLAHAGARRAEVEASFLPRADARERRAALLRQLEHSAAEGTLAALAAFASAHPAHGPDAHLPPSP